MAKNTIDPIFLEVMRNRIQSIADEMTASLVRTAYSTNIKDRMDCSCAILTTESEVVAQTELGAPFHLGVMPATAKVMLESIPLDQIARGDVLIYNNPYPEGPGHLNDVMVMAPVFYNNELIVLVANQAHHVDMGGFAPGSMPYGVTEIYQEGLQIPPIKLFSKNKLHRDVFSLILQNIRTPSDTKGDIMAQIAANNVGIKRLQEIIEKYGKSDFLNGLHEILDYGERSMRKGLSAVPQGTYEYEDFIEGSGFSEKLIKIKAVIEVKKNGIVVDFSETDKQAKGPMNARISAVKACVYYALKAIIDPTLHTNSGSYRPIKVKVKEGSLLQPRFPAPVCSANIITDQRIVDVIFGAFLKAVPERVCAACSGEMNMVNLGGIDHKRKSYFTYVETYGGGQGAMHCQDGMDGVHTHLTNTRNAPVEVIDATYPLRIDRYGLVPDSEGAGKYRGGFGMTREITILSNNATLTLGSDRKKIGPWGVLGGKNGGTSSCLIISKNGKKKTLPSKITTSLKQFDKIVVVTPGGGGWGNPLKRPKESIEKEIRDGLISKKRAKQVYGYSK